MTFLKHALILLLLVAVVGIAIMYSGIYNVSAEYPHPGIFKWFLDTTMERSVENHAKGVEAPADLDSPAMVQTGVKEFHEDCAGCHGAPGKEPAPPGKNMLPEPPDLKEAGEEMSPGEIYWVIKHGVRMTGMPAWGPHLEDKELWSLVALIKQFPEMTPQQYQALVAKAKQQKEKEPGKEKGREKQQ
ncbi:MAG TPA: cytochrome c [Gammaproteobacteria bacterium]|nr:cytochrome c [Gammaproteobacteria bacterium]